MLTTLDKLLFLHLLVDDLQDKLLHHLSQDGGEAHRPIVPWVLFLALFEGWSDNLYTYMSVRAGACVYIHTHTSF